MAILQQVLIPKIPTLLLSTTLTVFAALASVQAASTDNLEHVDCVIYPSQEADIGSASVGVLESLQVERSDHVIAGAVLAQLESSAQRAAVALATARAEAAAEVNFRQLSADHSKRQLSRIEQLVEKDSASIKEFDDRKTEAQLGEQQLRKALENKKILELELASAQVALEKRTIISPFSGVVVETYKSPGEYVNSDPILRIVQLDPLYVETIIPADQLGQIQPGMTARVVSAESANQQWIAQVDRVDSVIDVASGTFGVRLKLPNPDFAIAAGARCTVSFVNPEIRSLSEPTLGAAMPMNTTTLLSTDKSAPGISSDLTCINGGPYKSEQLAQDQASLASQRGDRVEVVRKRTTVMRGYFLMSREFQSMEAASTFLSALKSTGFTDAFLLGGTTPARVSIGAFNDHSTASKTMNSLLDNGIDSEVVQWENPNEQYFLFEAGAEAHYRSNCPSPPSSR